MGYTCVYFYCSSKTGRGKSLFRFPDDNLRAKAWLVAAGREDLLRKNLKNYKLCEDRFETRFVSVSSTGFKRLYDTAVPTIFQRPSTSGNDISEGPPKKIMIFSEGAELHEEYPVQQSTENSDEDTTASQIGIINENVAVVNFFDFNDKTPEQMPSHKEIKKMSGENTANEALKDPDWLFFNAMVPDFKRLSETRKEALKTKFLFLLRQELNEYEREKSIRGPTSSTSHAHVQSTVACASSVSQRSAIDVLHDQRCSHEAPSPKYPTTNPTSNQSQHQGTISTRVKVCFVKGCLSNSEGFPDKVFFTVPKDENRRTAWFEAARQPYLGINSTKFCCGDHFNLENDMENYVRWKLMGGQKIMKSDAIPHKFECQKRIKSTFSPSATCKAIKKTKADKTLKAIKAPSHSLQHQQQVVTTVNRANKFTIAKLGNGATSTSQASSLQASTSSTHALPISEGDIKIEIEEEKLFDPSSREYIEYPNTAKRARIEDDTTNVPTICSVKQEIEDATEDQDLVEAIEVKKEPGDDEPDVADYLSVAQIKMEIGDDFVG